MSGDTGPSKRETQFEGGADDGVEVGAGAEDGADGERGPGERDEGAAPTEPVDTFDRWSVDDDVEFDDSRERRVG